MADPLVHGIVSLDPPTIRCDGCGHEATGEITSDKKLPGATGDHLFRADREDVQRGGVA